jgi:YfiH family protein
VTIKSIDPPESKPSLWQWRHWQGLPYLTCDLLKDWSHGFFTAPFHPASPADLTAALSSSAVAYRLQQVHGNVVLKATEVMSVSPFSPADGLMGDGEDQALWVASADCSPVLIGDVTTGRSAALHSGWRGTAAGIVGKAIDLFLSHNSKPENLRVVIGPSISGEVYQVCEEVALQVGSSLFPGGTTIDELAAMNFTPIKFDPAPGKVRLSVTKFIRLQLLQIGLKPEQLEFAPFCTYQQPEYFFSYRRTGEKKVQWSGIVSKNSTFPKEYSLKLPD